MIGESVDEIENDSDFIVVTVNCLISLINYRKI